jgi:hypothetical protein
LDDATDGKPTPSDERDDTTNYGGGGVGMEEAVARPVDFERFDADERA